MTEEQEQNMPDFGNPKLGLGCSQVEVQRTGMPCKRSGVLCSQLGKDLRSTRKKPTEFEITETMDRYIVETCSSFVRFNTHPKQWVKAENRAGWGGDYLERWAVYKDGYGLSLLTGR